MLSGISKVILTKVAWIQTKLSTSVIAKQCLGMTDVWLFWLVYQLVLLSELLEALQELKPAHRASAALSHELATELRSLLK